MLKLVGFRVDDVTTILGQDSEADAWVIEEKKWGQFKEIFRSDIYAEAFNVFTEARGKAFSNPKLSVQCTFY